MNKNNLLNIFQRSFLKTLILLLAIGAFSASLQAETLTGTVNVVWGDAKPELHDKIEGKINFTLFQDNGLLTPVQIDQSVLSKAGGITKILNKRVSVETILPTTQKQPDNQPIKPNVTNITLLNDVSAFGNSNADTVYALAGSQKYVSIMCKFSDVSAEPQNWNFFNNMYGNSVGQLGHFWKEVSSDNVNLAGSRAYGGSSGNNGWYTLPHPKSTYVSGANADLDQLFTDCVGVANAAIDFSTVKGINMMFNSDIGDYAWGGTHSATLDGVTKEWPTTWEPDWGWSNVSVMAHEMGHSFGLPHSNNSDGDNNPYDSPWSVMSDAWDNAVQDNVYGKRGKHVNTYEKEKLNWLTNGEKVTVQNGETQTLDIDFSSKSLAGAGAYRMVKIPFLSGNNYYTVEARETSGDYESALPGTAVIIHSVDETRQEPSWVIDKDTPPADLADTEGVMWRGSETFKDTANNVEVKVNYLRTNGFNITVKREIQQPICPAGTTQNFLLNANFDSGLGSWTHASTQGTDAWSHSTNNPATGAGHIHGDDAASTSDSYIRSNLSLAIPNDAFLIFNHAYDFETGTSNGYDGGVVEYTTDNGATWQNAGSLFTQNGYNSSLYNENPLGDIAAFSSNSGGYISSRLDLSTLAGMNADFRFRIGTDTSTGATGWDIDDVQVYTCGTSVNTPSLLINNEDVTQYGWQYGTNQNKDNVTFQFDSNGQDRFLHITGYDVDFTDEVCLYLNDQKLSCLNKTPNNAHGTAQTITIPAALQQSAANILDIRQKVSGYIWGVTQIGLFDAEFALTLNQESNSQYGWQYGTSQHKDNIIFQFDSNDQDRYLHITGYDVDFTDEVCLFLNGQNIGCLDKTPNNSLGLAQVFTLPAGLQNNGVNILDIRQKVSGYIWGITNTGIFD